MEDVNINIENEAVEKTVELPEEIEFFDNGVRYRLAFDRQSAMQAEQVYDISLQELRSTKTYMIENLFAAAFLKHHPNIKPFVITKLWEKMTDKKELYQQLILMYANTAGSLLEEPEQGNGISWKAR